MPFQCHHWGSSACGLKMTTHFPRIRHRERLVWTSKHVFLSERSIVKLTRVCHLGCVERSARILSEKLATCSWSLILRWRSPRGSP